MKKFYCKRTEQKTYGTSNDKKCVNFHVQQNTPSVGRHTPRVIDFCPSVRLSVRYPVPTIYWGYENGDGVKMTAWTTKICRLALFSPGVRKNTFLGKTLRRLPGTIGCASWVQILSTSDINDLPTMCFIFRDMLEYGVT